MSWRLPRRSLCSPRASTPPIYLPARTRTFVDNVFDNRGVLWAARLLLVSAAAVLAFGGSFIVLSIGMRMKNREWLRRAGPFEISEGDLVEAEGEVEFWHQMALEYQGEAAELKDRLMQFDKPVSSLRDLG